MARVPRSGVLGALLNPVADKESNTRGNLFVARAFVFLLRRKAISFLRPYSGYSITLISYSPLNIKAQPPESKEKPRQSIHSGPYKGTATSVRALRVRKPSMICI